MKRTGFEVVLILIAALLAPAASAQTRADVTIFAAASLREALDELVREYERQGRGKAVVSYAGSPTLARQIEKGAPADIFISADTDWMDFLAARQLIRFETRVDLLSNRMVLIAHRGSQTTLRIGLVFRSRNCSATGGWRWRIPIAFPPESMERRRSKRWVSGERWRRRSPARRTCVPRWRWLPAAKLPLESFTGATRWPSLE